MIDLKVVPLAATEKLYAYNQNAQIDAQAGCIGNFRGDFGEGNDFFISWFDHHAAYKTAAFKIEADKVIEVLRQDGEVLSNLEGMNHYCEKYPESEMNGVFGFKLETPDYVFVLRCNPRYGDMNFYIYAYVRSMWEQHMGNAKQGIRFINTDYQELFHIPDGDKIRIRTASGEIRDRTCRFIDETHFETSSEYTSTVYDIHDFAERLEKRHGKVIPLRSSLPEKCFAILPGSFNVVIIFKGEDNFYTAEQYGRDKLTYQEARQIVDARNSRDGISKAQEAAMIAGVLFGWCVPSADPVNQEVGEGNGY